MAELLSGCINAQAQRRVEREVEAYSVMPINESISTLALEYYKRHRLANGVGYNDCPIGATAMRLGLTLYSLNVKNFRVLEGLRIEQPY